MYDATQPENPEKLSVRKEAQMKVMCKHQKWALQLDQDTSCSRPEEGNEESGGSSKRSRTTKEGECCANPNPETPTSGGSTS
ncbi:hypothetical protein R6Q57_003338 [Mikania cordata]